MSKPLKTPAFRIRRRGDSARAMVTLTDAVTGERRDWPLGSAEDPASKQRYHRLIYEWESCGRRMPASTPTLDHPGIAADVMTIDEVCIRFWKHAKSRYQPNHAANYKSLIRVLRRSYGSTPASEFGPLSLRNLRDQMVSVAPSNSRRREPWSRRYVNGQVMRLRQMFKWAASYEMIPTSTYEALKTVDPLLRGMTTAPDHEKVQPAPTWILDGALPQLNRQARAIADLQLLTGARPGELVIMRAVDIEMPSCEPVWIYRPSDHKNSYRSMDRVIFIGPKAQKIIEPFLANRSVGAFLFSPAEAEQARRQAVHKARVTPAVCGNSPGTNQRECPVRTAGDRYTTSSYRQAIHYACDRAFPAPAPFGRQDNETHPEWRSRLKANLELKAALNTWRRKHRFNPHQLRHNAGTEIRREAGLEAASIALGHASANITDAVYAERDYAKAIEIMKRIG